MEALKMSIKKSSKAMAVIANITYVALIVAVCLVLAAFVWMIISPDADFFMAGKVKFISPVGFTIENRGEVQAELCGIAASAIPMIFAFVFANRMAKAINKEGEPFTDYSVKSLRNIGISILAYALVTPFVRGIGYLIFAKGDFSANAAIDMMTILIALIFFFLATIFKYGANLRQLSDETL